MRAESVSVLRAEAILRICLAPECVESALPGYGYCSRCVGKFPRVAERASVRRYRENAGLAEKLAALSSGASFLYCAQAGEWLKFGVARNVAQRIRDLQCGNPVPIALLGSVRCVRRFESDVHAHLAADRVRGEWFRMSPAAMRIVEIIKARDVLALQKELGCCW